MNTNCRQWARRSRRKGVSVAEVLVSAVLLVAVISLTGGLMGRIQRIEKGTQQYQAAVDELANQLERIVMLDPKAREEAIQKIAVSPGLENILGSAVFTLQEQNDADGNRITLSIHWDRSGPSEPVSLTAWISDPTLRGTTE